MDLRLLPLCLQSPIVEQVYGGGIEKAYKKIHIWESINFH